MNTRRKNRLSGQSLSGYSIAEVAKNAYINSGQLYQWVRRYNGKGIDGFQCKKGRSFIVKKRKRNCIDNCIMESLFGTLKKEMFYGHESELKKSKT